MKLLRTLVCAITIGLSVALFAASDLPAPRAVAIADNPDDNEGTSVLVTWQKPAEPAATEFVLGGYEVFIAQTGRTVTDFRTVAVVPDPDETRWIVKDLSWRRKYRSQVRALYVPQGQSLQINPTEPLEPTNEVLRRSAAASSTMAATPRGIWYNAKRTNVLVWVLVYSVVVVLAIILARRRELYIRPIAGLKAVNDAIGRATEMGRPVLFVTGLSGISDVANIAAMLILGHLARRTAQYETPLIVPNSDPLVMAAEREIVREAYLEAGKPQLYDPDNVFFITDSQFGFVAAVDGIMMREKPAANFYMGYFFAESLILAETGNASGAMQIAGTDADTQLPFFITACDYTLMGEELYAAGAYLSGNPLLVAQLKGQDVGKILIIAALLVGAAAATLAGLYPDLPVVHEILNFFAEGG
ncbi:MAG: DUF6754 domain-containing protein [Armatimonadota bacterium]